MQGGESEAAGLGAEVMGGLGRSGMPVQEAEWGIGPPGDGLVGPEGWEVAEGGGDVEVVGVGTRAGGGAEQVLELGAERGVEMEVVATVGSGEWGKGPPGEAVQGGESEAEGLGPGRRGLGGAQGGRECQCREQSGV